MRGTQIAADQAVVSGGGDLDVLPGASPTLVVVGSTTYNSRTFWSAAAFNNFDGDLAQAGYGDLLIPTDEYGALLGVQAAGDALAVTGSLLDVSGSFDTSFGTLRLRVDADKQCDLAIDVPAPLEARFTGDRPVPTTITVTNEGRRTCIGQITVPPEYSLAMGGLPGALNTGPLGPGATFTTAGATLAYGGPRRREDIISVRVAAAGDVAAENDAHLLHVLFSWCDLALQRASRGRLVPNEGARRFEFVVRNVGSGRCRGVQLAAAGGGRTAGKPDRYALAAGRSAEDAISARLAAPARPGAKVALAFSRRRERGRRHRQQRRPHDRPRDRRGGQRRAAHRPRRDRGARQRRARPDRGQAAGGHRGRRRDPPARRGLPLARLEALGEVPQRGRGQVPPGALAAGGRRALVALAARPRASARQLRGALARPHPRGLPRGQVQPARPHARALHGPLTSAPWRT